jgi:hypothetical protein
MADPLPSTWEQTLEDVTVSAVVPAGTPGKMMNRRIKKDRLAVGIKRKPPIVDGRLSEVCRPGDSTWTIAGAPGAARCRSTSSRRTGCAGGM